MNEHEESAQPPIIAPFRSLDARSGHPRPFSWWLRKLFAGNPFYLVSAALLLYGCYRVSIDAPFLNHESARLLFNFTSVQIYEVLLVLTAIFLARRHIWYDSTLLVGLENLLVFAPFILISQAALIDSQLALAMSLIGGAIAVLRFGSMKRFFTQLNLPGRLLIAGFILLALNATLPLVYRHFGDTKFGAHLDYGPAYEMNECTWLLILPAVLALANLLPRAKEAGSLLPQHRWLPTGLFTLWIAVTGVHLYSLDYVNEFYMRSELFAPAAWVLAWTCWLRLHNKPIMSGNRCQFALAFPPVLVPLLATSPGGQKTFLILTALNMAVYCCVCWFARRHWFARHLLFASVMMFVAGLPEFSTPSLSMGLSRAACVASGVMVYLIFWTVLLRNPKLAIFGSILLGFTVASLFGNHANAIYWAFQCGLVFLLLHSLRWDEAEHQGADKVRTVFGLVWVMQSFLWMNSDTGRFWMPCIPGAIVLGTYLAAQMSSKRWDCFSLPVAATLVILSGPGNAIANQIWTMSAGILAVGSSFLLFGFGTAAALTKHLWHKHEPAADVEAQKATNTDDRKAD